MYIIRVTRIDEILNTEARKYKTQTRKILKKFEKNQTLQNLSYKSFQKKAK